jgi:glycine dehydrogenase subunit 1
MRYLPKSPADRKEMLAEIGVASIDDLFATIPAEYQLKRDLKVPRQHGESRTTPLGIRVFLALACIGTIGR